MIFVKFFPLSIRSEQIVACESHASEVVTFCIKIKDQAVIKMFHERHCLERPVMDLQSRETDNGPAELSSCLFQYQLCIHNSFFTPKLC